MDIVLFFYDKASRDFFQNLVYWVDGVGEILNDAILFILLGTHLDRVDDYEILQIEMEKAMGNLSGETLELRPTWKGNCASLDASNLIGENLNSWLDFLLGCVISSPKILY